MQFSTYYLNIKIEMKGSTWTGASLAVCIHTLYSYSIFTHFNNSPIILIFSLHINAILFIVSFLPAVILPNRYNIPWLVKNLMAQPDFCCSTHSSQVDEKLKEPIKLCLQDQELDLDEPPGSPLTQDILPFYDSG